MTFKSLFMLYHIFFFDIFVLTNFLSFFFQKIIYYTHTMLDFFLQTHTKCILACISLSEASVKNSICDIKHNNEIYIYIYLVYFDKYILSKALQFQAQSFFAYEPKAIFYKEYKFNLCRKSKN